MENHAVPQFPADFFSFAKGVKIENERIQNWITVCIQSIRNNPKEYAACIQSGNTLVIAKRSTDEVTGKDKIDVYVSQQYYSCENIDL